MDQLKELVAGARQGGVRTYPKHVKQRVMAYAMEPSLSTQRVAFELRLNKHTLRTGAKVCRSRKA